MAKLYGKIFEDENIESAIKTILKHEGSKTPGPDGITKDNISRVEHKKIVKEVKMRLRRCTKVNSRTIEIPKSSGKARVITIINLYDRMAQQAVYQVVAPILEAKFSKNSYGFREGQSTKIPVSKIVGQISNAKCVYTIEIDFKQCFDQIPLNAALRQARSLGITNGKVLETIKHLMRVSKEYNGIGLSQGTILGPILANCYLHQLDVWIQDNVNQENERQRWRNVATHPNDYAEWLISRGRKPHGIYYRYADDSIIICNTRSEQLYINEQLRSFIDNNLEIEINEEKSRLRYNSFNFLGYHIRKKRDENTRKWCTNITPAEPEELRKRIRKLRFRGANECVESLKVIIGIMNYYDICNNMTQVVEWINNRMYHHSLRHGSCLQVSWDAKTKKRYYVFNYNGKRFNVSPWVIRKKTKVSTKEYMINSVWLTLKDQLNEVDTQHIQPYQLEKITLWTRQKGRDYCTKRLMNPKDIHIHHLNGNHRDDRLKNLVLVSTETHRLIHSNTETDNREIINCRKALTVQ